MRVFVTGATGTIGSAVTAELLTHGHTVLALARSGASAEKLRATGAQALPGSLTDLDVLRAGAAQTDGVIHLAFDHDLTAPEALDRAITQETAALHALGAELTGSDRPLVTVSGTPWVPGRASTEADPLPTDGPVGGRGRTVTAILDLASQGVRTAAVRMPRTVHHEGRGGFAGLLTDAARRSGVVGYPGDGTQRWPAVHALDAAALFRLALESAPAGTSWHAVADEGDAVRDIAAVIGRRLELPVEPVPEETFGPFGPIFAMDQPSTSTRTRRTLGWNPRHPSLLQDLENIER
ncbi:nucleoside-diphosphate-sugar epimerase [Kineococcus radiotolerans]|uniref:Nucleoside-diphosphate-sugar epimerase n=1 Tax=Kineococcus radiotolerans TaxID=131568 RepID=A0A7W4TIV9_KINRA|nr:SDR family oxidoreductase [Kineococcus radiotolerans]MBB2899277.1 nucleoside-diphosphate-sugar epimerase [Kineococcus radiotolerans]